MYQKCLRTVQEAKLDMIRGKQKIDTLLFWCSFVFSKFPSNQELEN